MSGNTVKITGISEAAQRKLVAQMVADGQISDVESPRGRLLNAAARLFEEKGYARTTVRDIAAEVGILSGSIFHHFSSKEELLCCVMQEVTQHARARMEVAISEQGSARSRVRACIQCELEAIHGLAVPGFSILVSEWRSLSPANQKLVLRRRDQYEQIWLDCLAAVYSGATGSPGQAADAASMDPRLVRKLLLGALVHTRSWFKPRGRGLSLSSLAEQVLLMFCPR